MVVKAWNRAMHVQRKGPNAWQDPSKARYASLMMPLLPQHCLRDNMLHAINAETTARDVLSKGISLDPARIVGKMARTVSLS